MRTTVATAVALAALFAAGCGGGGGSPEAESWASDVCSDLTQWQTEVQTIATNATKAVTSGTASGSELRDAIDRGLQASRNLARKLRALGAPPVEQGDDARQEIESLAGEVEDSVDDVRQALAGLPKNASVAQIVQSLSRLATQLQANLTSAQATMQRIGALSSDFKDGVENAEPCKKLRGEGS